MIRPDVAGEVAAVPVVGDHHPVGGVEADGQRAGQLRVREVDGGDVAGGQRGGVERVAVRREAALVAEDPDRRAALQRRGAAVLVEVVDVDDAGIDDRVAGHRGQQAALLVEHQRLVRGLHRGGGERRGLHRLGGIAHVEHGDAGRALGERLHVAREQQGRVVVRALAPCLVLEAQRLVAAGGAVPADQRHVAVEAGRRAGGHAALDAGLAARARPAVRRAERAPAAAPGPGRRAPGAGRPRRRRARRAGRTGPRGPCAARGRRRARRRAPRRPAGR